MNILDRIFKRRPDHSLADAERRLHRTRELVQENRQIRRELAELTGNIVRDQLVLGTNRPRLEGDLSERLADG